MELSQSTCLITGASGGIGQAIARSLYAQGAALVLVGRNPAALNALNTELGGAHQCLVADIMAPAGRNQIAAAVSGNPALTLVVQAAGSSSFGEFGEQTDADIENTIALNLTAPMLIARAILPALLQRPQATLVNVGSAFGNIGFPCFSTYCASKFGLRGFTEALQREYAGSALNIVYFAPRATQTSFNSSAVDEMNRVLGNQTDSPERVAEELVRLLKRGRRRAVVGWPEKLFCRLNGLLPELVDRALASKRNTIIEFAKQHHLEGKQL